jgi:hypothetical protein
MFQHNFFNTTSGVITIGADKPLPPDAQPQGFLERSMLGVYMGRHTVFGTPDEGDTYCDR